MLQIVNAVFKDADDDTSISLIYANQTEEDILCREDLEKARDQSNGRFKLWYTVDRPPAGKLQLQNVTFVFGLIISIIIINLIFTL